MGCQGHEVLAGPSFTLAHGRSRSLSEDSSQTALQRRIARYKIFLYIGAVVSLIFPLSPRTSGDGYFRRKTWYRKKKKWTGFGSFPQP